MGGESKLKPDSFNAICAKWVNGFLEKRCIVRQNRWEYIGDLYAAYQEYAKKNSGSGYNLRLTQQRFSRVLTIVFKENKWFMDKITTPDGSKRLRVGLCLKEHSTMRSPEDLYPSMRKADKKAQAAATAAPIQSPHFNPDSADRASEAPGKSQAERDKLAQELWDKG